MTTTPKDAAHAIRHYADQLFCHTQHQNARLAELEQLVVQQGAQLREQAQALHRAQAQLQEAQAQLAAKDLAFNTLVSDVQHRLAQHL